MIKRLIGFNSPEVKKRLWKLTVAPYNSIVIGAIVLTFLNARVWKIEGRD